MSREMEKQQTQQLKEMQQRLQQMNGGCKEGTPALIG